MRYLPHTPEEIEEMLKVVGRASLDDLFETVPKSVRFTEALKVEPALAEPELMRLLRELSEKNQGAHYLSFLGAGMYAHHVPPAVDQLTLRSEFYTAYTPYQPEVSQGTLQVIWEFQTIVSELLGLPLSNASVYDGASAAAEGALMACRLTKRGKVVVSGCVHPDYRGTIRTYLSGRDPAAYVEVPAGPDGAANLSAIAHALGPEVAAVVLGYPSFFGAITDLRPVAKLAHDAGALLVTATTEPYALALVEPPGASGADIAVAEGQAVACPPSLGGPGVGLFACRDDRQFLQQMPGRICGETVDANGERGYVLTLSTREQHIRRERATSNICTNQGLVALALTIRMSLLGKQGFIQVAEQCFAKARYLEQALLKLPGYSRGFTEAAFFNEFCVRVRGGSAARVIERAEAQGIVAGFDLGRVDPAHADKLLIAVTENHRRADLDRLVSVLSEV
jgi:glycine dehydrogenase subunit 1